MKKLSAILLMSLVCGGSVAAFADPGPQPAPTPYPGPWGPDRRGPIDPVPPPVPPPDFAS